MCFALLRTRNGCESNTHTPNWRRRFARLRRSPSPPRVRKRALPSCALATVLLTNDAVVHSPFFEERSKPLLSHAHSGTTDGKTMCKLLLVAIAPRSGGVPSD